MPAYAALVAFLVGLPAIGLGMIMDDHFLRVTMLRDPAYAFVTKPALDVFRLFEGEPMRTMQLIDRGCAVWWSDPNVRIAFFRPLTAATHLFDFTIAEDAAWWMHLHSLFYYALASSMAALVFRSLIGPGAAAGFAALLFAIDATHGMLVGWIANRNQLVAAVFALASFAVYLRWGTRSTRSAGNMLLGPTLLALGFAGGEAALCILAYFAAHALVLDTRTHGERLAAAAPYLLVTLAWAICYRAGGYGTSGSGFYHDPLGAPLAYAAAAAQHLPILAMNELVGLPADLFVVLPWHARVGFVALALLLALAVCAIVLPTLRRDAEARFFGLAGVLSLLPVCATGPSARLLLVPSVGLIGLMVRFVAATRAEERAAPEARRGGRSKLTRVYAGYFLLCHLLFAVPMFHVMARQLSMVEELLERLAEGLDGDSGLPTARVVLLNAPDGTFMSYVGLLRHVTGRPTPYAITPLALGTRGLTVARTKENTLRVRQDGGFALSPTERFTSNHEVRWHAGSRVHLTGLTIQVVQVTSDGRPQTVDFIFDHALADSSLRFKEWDGDTLVPFVVPEVGAWRRIEARALFGALSAS